MTTHELARKLLKLPNVEVFLAQPRNDYHGHVSASLVARIDTVRCVEDGRGLRILDDDEEGQAGATKQVVISDF